MNYFTDSRAIVSWSFGRWLTVNLGCWQRVNKSSNDLIAKKTICTKMHLNSFWNDWCNVVMRLYNNNNTHRLINDLITVQFREPVTFYMFYHQLIENSSEYQKIPVAIDLQPWRNTKFIYKWLKSIKYLKIDFFQHKRVPLPFKFENIK